MPSYNVLFDDSSPKWQWQGEWREAGADETDIDEYMEQTFHETYNVGANVTFRFNGTGISIYGSKRSNHGQYLARIDGNETSLDGFDDKNLTGQIIFAAANLSPWGEHEVVLSNLGTNLTRFRFDIDYAVVTLGDGNKNSAAIGSSYDDVYSSNITYSGSWKKYEDSNSHYNSTIHSTSEFGSAARIQFYGNAVAIYGSISPQHGPFTMSLDGAPALELNGRSSQTKNDTILYHWSSLELSMHTIVMTHASENSSDIFDFDRFAVTSWINSTTSTSSSSASSTGTHIATSSSSDSDAHKANIGLIIGVSVSMGIIVITFVLLMLGIWLLRKRKLSTPVHLEDSRDALLEPDEAPRWSSSPPGTLMSSVASSPPGAIVSLSQRSERQSHLSYTAVETREPESILGTDVRRPGPSRLHSLARTGRPSTLSTMSFPVETPQEAPTPRGRVVVIGKKPPLPPPDA